MEKKEKPTELDLEKELKLFFYYHTSEYDITKLINRFNLNFEDIPIFIKLLYQLECQGIIYQNSRDNYVSTKHLNFRYVCGQLKISKKKNLYVDLKDGRKVLLTKEDAQEHAAHIGDYLWIEPKEKIHSKCMTGTIKKVVNQTKPPLLKTCVIEGTLKKDLSKNAYYIMYDNIEIPIKNVRGALLRDHVLAEVNLKDGEYTGEVVETITRAREERVFILDNGTWTSFENSKMKATLVGEPKEYQEGTRVLATYSYNEEKNKYYIHPIKVIESTNMDKDIVCLAEENGFSQDFDDKVLKEISIITPEKSLYDDRIDLRNLPTFTIDPIYARDLDDAVSIKKLSNGYVLYVHIADVPAYVPFDSEMMDEACKRGTSCYLSHFVFPMLPFELTNHLCSLNPGEDKLTKTFEMRIDNSGNVKKFIVYNSLIRSEHQFDYGTVNALLTKGIIQKDILPYASTLLCMQELSDLLEKKKKERGALDLDTREMRFEYGALGNTTHLEEEIRGPANKMIENFMLTTNEQCAKFAQTLDLPFIYRYHDVPTYAAINRLKKQMQTYYQSVKNIKDFDNPANMQRYLTKITRKSNEEEIQHWANIFLRSLTRARYSSKPYRHYGLNLDCYATVTSPIRRFADLANHTSISEYQKNGLISDKMERIREMTEAVCDHLSEQQKLEDELERASQFMLLHNYASNFLDQLMLSSIEFLGDGQIFAKTYNNIPGTIYLPGSTYDRQMRGIHYNDKYYQVGDTINTIIIPSKNKMQGIEFQLVPECQKLGRRKKQ